jgi:hypothetical protein
VARTARGGRSTVDTGAMPPKTKADRLVEKAENLPPRDVTEAQFQAWVVRRARERGWQQQFHVLRAQVKDGRWLTSTSTPGVPDLWLLRPPQLVVLELKRWGGKATPEQAKWIAGLQKVPGIEAFVVSPEHAEDVLDLLAPLPPPG